MFTLIWVLPVSHSIWCSALFFQLPASGQGQSIRTRFVDRTLMSQLHHVVTTGIKLASPLEAGSAGWKQAQET